MNKIFIIAKREYIKVIRKPAFWISTLFFPIFIIVVSLISGFSSNFAVEKLKNAGEGVKEILIFDQSYYIHPDKYVKPFVRITDIDLGRAKVRSGEVDAFILVPNDFSKTKRVEIYQQDQGLFLQTRFNEVATNLIKDSILSELNDQQKKTIYSSDFQFVTTNFKNGEIINRSIQDLIVPGISVFLYFILTTFATSYLLLSVAEEKENRIMEIVLSTVKPKELISGKILGLVGIIITQVIFLTVFSIVGLAVIAALFSSQINLSQVTSGFDMAKNIIPNINIGQVLLGIFYTLIGFFILACTMVGVGSAMPTYREAQSMSSIFIILSILPIYFITIIIAEPSGIIAQIFSYIPFTSSFILLFRNALGALNPFETIISGILLLIYAYIALVLAFKLFELGSLEYSKRISLSSLFSRK